MDFAVCDKCVQFTQLFGFEVKRTKAVNQVVRALKINDDLYAKSNHLEEYRNDYVITDINGVEDSVTFRNGIKLYAGDVAGSVNETQLLRIQIRETILSHIEKEQELFEKDIKVLSLFYLWRSILRELSMPQSISGNRYIPAD